MTSADTLALLQSQFGSAIVAADGRWESIPWWQRGYYGASAVQALLPALASYRLGRYDDALKELAALEYQWVTSYVSGFAVPRQAWAVAAVIRTENLRRHTPLDQRTKPLLDVMLLRALVLAKQGKAEEARVAWEVTRTRMRATGAQREIQILHGLVPEAEAAFARPPKEVK